MPADSRTSMRRLRLTAHAPRVAFVTVCAVLALAGLRSIFAGSASPPTQTLTRSSSAGTTLTSFAEAFARVYLTFGPDGAARRERRLAPFLGQDLDPDAGLQPASGTSQHASWVTTRAVQAIATDRWLVTVVVATNSGQLRYLAVPVLRDPSGGLAVDDYPALVGPPVRARRSPTSDPPALTDQPLANVATRALGNYLRGARQNLQADLAPGAAITTPGDALQLSSVDSIGWLRPGRVLSAAVSVTDRSGTRMRMRFLVSVVKRDRWYVRAINNPAASSTTKGLTP